MIFGRIGLAPDSRKEADAMYSRLAQKGCRVPEKAQRRRPTGVAKTAECIEACQSCDGRGFEIITWVSIGDGTRGKSMRFCMCTAGREMQKLWVSGHFGNDYLQQLLEDQYRN